MNSSNHRLSATTTTAADTVSSDSVPSKSLDSNEGAWRQLLCVFSYCWL
jgi:hypothetical protein